ncbi:Uncharacterised protein [Mycobacteroides abscessus]|nr:Uncharacterised protein [Mycobacteroides abscessus]
MGRTSNRATRSSAEEDGWCCAARVLIMRPFTWRPGWSPPSFPRRCGSCGDPREGTTTRGATGSEREGSGPGAMTTEVRGLRRTGARAREGP